MIELLFVLVIGGVLTYLTWSAINSETDDTQVMDRRSAERQARSDAPEEDDGWGTRTEETESRF